MNQTANNLIVRHEDEAVKEASACGYRYRLLSQGDKDVAAWAHAVDIDGAKLHRCLSRDFFQFRTARQQVVDLGDAVENFAACAVAARFPQQFVPRGFKWHFGGFEHRIESTSKRPDALLASASTIGGTNFQATRGDRRISEFYAETILPVWKSPDGFSSMVLEAAIRYSDYSDFGDSTTPKLGMRLQSPHDRRA